MTLTLTPEALAAAYDYLCEFPPFDKWNMPHSEDVKFLVTRHDDRFAHYQMVDGIHNIAISTKFVNRHDSLLSTMSHEMIHLHTRATKMRMRNVHGRAFQMMADEVCTIHGFDRLNF